MKISYRDLPLDSETEDWDLSKFSDEQLAEFYWDNPESIPDGVIL